MEDEMEEANRKLTCTLNRKPIEHMNKIPNNENTEQQVAYFCAPILLSLALELSSAQGLRRSQYNGGHFHATIASRLRDRTKTDNGKHELGPERRLSSKRESHLRKM